MAIEEPPGGVRPFARPFNLVPPTRDKQFRAGQIKVERSKRKAERRVRAALEARTYGDAPPRGVDLAELARLWGSFGYRELRRDLSPHEAEELHRRLAAVLAHEEGAAAVWWATISALREVRRAAEVPIGAPSRKWRQSFPDLNGW